MGYGFGITMSCGVGRRRGSDPSLLWLWCRPASVAQIGTLVWESPYAAGSALKTKQNKTREFPCGSTVMNLTRNHEDVGSITILAPWVKDPSLW